MKVQSRIWGAALALVLSAGSATAGLIIVENYSMPNGSGVLQSGFLSYFDGNYNGSGNKFLENAPLSGGTGALTDGIIASLRWDNTSVNNTNDSGTGKYVGWQTQTFGNPVITFNFDGTQNVQRLDMWVDASNNGLVGAPVSMMINGLQYFATPSNGIDPTCPNANNNTAACALQLTVLGSWIGESIVIQPKAGDLPWIMISEVQFSNAVPEPSTWALMLLGFAGVGYAAYRRSRKNSGSVATA